MKLICSFFKKFAMVFVQDKFFAESLIFDIHSEVKRPQPDMIRNPEDHVKYRKWLCVPKGKKNDLYIFGVNHKSNGIQTSIVVHVLPHNCSQCGFSSEDPVIGKSNF